MRVACQHRQVADAVVTRAAAKIVVESERRERRVASGAASGDGAARSIHQAAFGEKAGAVDAISDVDDAPVSLQPLAVGTTEPRAAAVVHIQDRDAAAGPVLDAEVQGAGCRSRGAAVALDQQRWPLALGTLI